MNLVPLQLLQELTDRKHPSEVIAWLHEHQWRFTVSATGRPKVDTDEYRRHMIGGESELEKHPHPDLSWFDGQKKKTA